MMQFLTQELQAECFLSFSDTFSNPFGIPSKEHRRVYISFSHFVLKTTLWGRLSRMSDTHLRSLRAQSYCAIGLTQIACLCQPNMVINHSGLMQAAAAFGGR